MATALIVGASRGIGFELARQYRADGWRVIATVRRSEDGNKLSGSGCEVLILDVDDAEQCAAVGWQLDDERLDVAILVAGVYGPHTSGLESPSADDFDAVMHSNVLGAMRLLPLIGPLVVNGHGRLAVVSSMMGSIGMRSGTAGWLYRASKAALNSVLADAALTYGPAGAICVSLHPGWVQTDMGGTEAALTVAHSVSAMRATLAQLSAGDNGKFLNYEGKALSW